MLEGGHNLTGFRVCVRWLPIIVDLGPLYFSPCTAPYHIYTPRTRHCEYECGQRSRPKKPNNPAWPVSRILCKVSRQAEAYHEYACGALSDSWYDMAPFIYRCPNTGLSVQGWVADDPTDREGETYHPITCTICTQVHLDRSENRKGATGEDQAEIDLLPIEADAAACGDGDSLVVERVVEVWQAFVGTR